MCFFFQGLFLLFLVRVFFFIFTYFRSPFFSVSLPHFVYFHPKKGKFLFDRIFFSLFAAVVVRLLSLFEGDSKKKTIFLFYSKNKKKKTCLKLFFFSSPRISTTSEQTNKNLKPCLFVRMFLVCVYVFLCVCVVSLMFKFSLAHTRAQKKNAIFSCTSLLLTTVSPFSLSPLFFSKKKYSPKPFTFFFLCFYFLSAAFKLEKNKTKKVRIIFLDDKNNKKKNSIINIWSNHFVFYFRFYRLLGLFDWGFWFEFGASIILGGL